METVLEKVIGLDYEIEGSGERWRHTAEHNSLVLDLEEQKWFWNSKELYYKTPEEYLILIKGYSKKAAKEFLRELESVSISSSFYAKKEESTVVTNEKLVDLFWKNGLKNREYWYYRGLNDRTIDSFKLGKFDGFFTIPIYMEDCFRNFQCRRDVPEKKIRPWYRGVGPLLFNSSILKFVDTVYITEGPVDAMLLVQMGFPALSHTGGSGGWKNEWFKYFIKTKKIYYIADNDQVGLEAGFKVSNSLGNNKVQIVQFKYFKEKYDTVDFFRDGYSIDEFKDLVSVAKYSYEIKKEN